MTPKLKQDVESAANECETVRQKAQFNRGAQFAYDYLLKHGPEFDEYTAHEEASNKMFMTSRWQFQRGAKFQHQQDAAFISARDERIKELEKKLEIAVKALKDIESEEINSQRPGGGYSRSAIISFKAIKEIEGGK